MNLSRSKFLNFDIFLCLKFHLGHFCRMKRANTISVLLTLNETTRPEYLQHVAILNNYKSIFKSRLKFKVMRYGIFGKFFFQGIRIFQKVLPTLVVLFLHA